MTKYDKWRGQEDNNSTTLFLLPMTNMQLGDFYSKGFVRAFLGDDEMPEETKDKILIVLKPENEERTEIFMRNRVRNNKLYLFEYDVDDLLVIVFDVPRVWEEVITLFKTGQYSKFPDDYKRVYFPQISPVTNRESHMYKILYKKEDAFRFLETKYDIYIPRKQEAWSKPRCHEEIFRFNETNNDSALCWKN